ncbi:preprotein translocase subunit SecE [Luteimicrobium subarcticum]|uniref:Protein translocase subunit SecE n=1 Tax=Luteimicrobium subarcticum TaxID=620910 RepID=A0A2M8WVJ6_9MICO|nr:preprotein translocase subunit SecE [Luteimicrobium subarcticum]PJI94942.1 preprotein translocase subunit SecE [Luteimicrobium subarcticum]
MSDSASGSVSANDAPAPKKRSASSEKKGFFGRIVLFVRQVVAELKKVHTPTRTELFTYTAVVLVFVTVIMAFVTLVDFGIGKAVLWVFGS